MKTQTTQTAKNQAGNAPYLSLIMGGALAMSQTTAMGQTPPPLINGLPPAPPIPENDNQIDFDATPLPPVPIINNYAPKTPVTTTPTPPSQPAINIPVNLNDSGNQTNLNGQGWYRVDVFGDSPMMLAQVQQVEPKAFIRSGEGVIQAGIFSEQINAQKLRQSLEENGLRTQIIALTSTSNKPSSSLNIPKRKKGYFVVIPGDKKKLARIINQVLDSGIEKSSVSLQDYPRGDHLGIGPFERRTDAQRWNAHFRSLGMDARVYFGR
jgi:hypothetical protein